ncbi:MAG: hypothetical protein QOF18_272 [Frankiaceae bacterium]|jgi:hypothetical protein|nr:hypothetical protein [Frankiaceae bacterium]
MAQIPVEVPDEVFAMALDGPALDCSRWNGSGVPAGVVLRWIDAQPFGAWSAALLAMVDQAELGPGDMPRYIRLLDRAESFQAARKAAAIFALAGAKETARDFRDVDSAPHELTVALRIPLGAAQTDVYRARRLATHLLGTRALFADGLITVRHVAKIVAGTGRLDPAACAAVEQLVLADAETLSVHEFARRVRRAVAKVHPRTLRDRHADAAKDSDVGMDADDDAMAWLTARMPLLDAVIVKKAVDRYALDRKHAGDPRPLGVLRAEGLRVMAEGYLSGRLTGARPTEHGRPVEVQICATPEAMLGLADSPAEIPGVGPVPIETVRAMAHEAKLRWLTIDGDTGQLLDRNPTTWRIPAPLHAHADTAYVTSVGPHSTVPAVRCDGEHLITFPLGRTITANIAPMDRGWHRAKTFGGFLATRRPDGSIEWLTPLGQTLTIEPYDYRLGP